MITKPLPREQRDLTRRQFAIVKREWDDYLESEGYRDAEYQKPDGADPEWLRATPKLKNRSMEAHLEWQSQMAEYAAAETEWRSDQERQIYLAIQSGRTYRQIQKDTGRNLFAISTIFHHYEARRKAWWDRTEPDRVKASKVRGRPPSLEARDKRFTRVSIRVSVTELRQLTAMAAALDAPISSAVRNVALQLVQGCRQIRG
jgi:hypothetical protein